MSGYELAIWTIYDHPLDLPDYFVARKWLCSPHGPEATDEVLMDTDLNRLRAKLPPMLYCMPRKEKDDPVIIETWI